jgi:hypothetical protein
MSQQPREPVKTQREEPYNAGDPESIKRQAAKKAEIDRRLVSGLKAIVEHPDARFYLWNLLEFCGINRGSFTGNSETFWLEGARNVGLKVQYDLTKHFPDSYVQMMREAQNDQTRGYRNTTKTQRADAQ